MITTLPAGIYYIGDPCYVFSDNWDRILDETSYFEEIDNQQIDGHKIAVGSTFYGDGIYKDQEGYVYPVDAGLIGAIPLVLLDIDNILSKEEIINQKFGRIIKLEEDTLVEINNGRFHFGNIFINTI